MIITDKGNVELSVNSVSELIALGFDEAEARALVRAAMAAESAERNQSYRQHAWIAEAQPLFVVWQLSQSEEDAAAYRNACDEINARYP